MEKHCLVFFIEKNCKKFDIVFIKVTSGERGMSSIVFVSNQLSSRRNDQTNDFEIDIVAEIDARSGNKQIVVEEILYPNTISTIHPWNKEDFKMKIVFTVEHFIKKKIILILIHLYRVNMIGFMFCMVIIH